MRGHGMPYIRELQTKPLDDLQRLFNIIPAKLFRETLLSDAIVTGNICIPEGMGLLTAPLTAEQRASLAPVYDQFLSALAALNRSLTVEERHFLHGTKCHSRPEFRSGEKRDRAGRPDHH